ncbi:MAG: alcohol dehydrogenase catalytic domain-containing protein [Spirochaetales bacterium]|nr:alcohol dehydrogenase catalytic domain-containing protein [Spirochaetales bacterium]
MKAKVAFLYGPEDLRVEEVDVPKLQPNQVLIKTGACGICGSDVECYEGDSAEGRYDLGPYTPGHEWGGKIVEVGSGLRSSLKVGDKVTGDCVMGCGVCENCKDGKMPSACLNFREIGFRPDSPGGMGEYMVVEEQYVHKIPDAWSYADGAWVETFSIGYFGIWGNGGCIDASDIAIINGAGPVGLSAAMVAATSGAKTIVVDPLKNRRDTALKFGAEIVLDPTEKSIYEQVMDVTGGHGGDVCVEASGNDNAIASLFDISAHSARVRLIGHSIGRKVPVEIGKTIWKTLSIAGSGGTKDFGQRTIRFMNRIRDKYDFEALNSHYVPFEKIDEGFDIAIHNKAEALKVMLTFDE